MSTWVIAAVLATTVSLAAYRVGALSFSGAIAAILLGTVTVGTGGWWAGMVLVVFFVSSSLLGRLTRSGEPQARGSRRDWVQVLANGGLLLLCCVLYAVTDWVPWLWFGVGSIAAATADTWSSEIGRTSTKPPRNILSWQQVPAGTSGAVSVRGLLATMAGAALIGAIAALTLPVAESNRTIIFLGMILAGTAGSLADSLLGASIQEQRWCDSCNKGTEANPHRCGSATRQISGVTGFNNDVVNILCALSGALIGLVSSIL